MRIGRVALEHHQVDHGPVNVVGDLGFVTELDRLAEPAFGDGAGVGVVQRHGPGRPVGDLAREPCPCLGDYLLQELGRLFDLADEGDRFA
jgi:hypothetical protein